VPTKISTSLVQVKKCWYRRHIQIDSTDGMPLIAAGFRISTEVLFRHDFHLNVPKQSPFGFFTFSGWLSFHHSKSLTPTARSAPFASSADSAPHSSPAVLLHLNPLFQYVNIPNGAPNSGEGEGRRCRLYSQPDFVRPPLDTIHTKKLEVCLEQALHIQRLARLWTYSQLCHMEHGQAVLYWRNYTPIYSSKWPP
jgi:hypothetical protein